MARVTPVYRPQDYPGEPDTQTRDDLVALFAFVAPGSADPLIDRAHAGMAVAAHSPAMAMHLARLTTTLARNTGWSERRDLFELAVQAVNLRFGSSFGFEARRPHAESSGLGLDRLDAIAAWRTSALFDAEQVLVLEYVEAVTCGDVPEALFARVRDAFGERGAIECTAVIGCFAMWAMLINATGPTF